MKLSLWTIGKVHDPLVRDGILEFTTRINRYFQMEWKIFPVPKHSTPEQLKKAEAELIINALEPEDYLVLLDEKGKSLTSIELADFIQKRANDSGKSNRLIFLIGGAYGVDQSVFQKAKMVWSLSSLTFPHQLVRLILAEQLYRACTILRNEKYHHN
ncbi:MAG: 23S rRNA (pseudouridine(1915)-N(3))-methyltransferase RlmH [Sphingobacteriales bacterium]|jgi:23S rRNA (pseudouridine1915-N3)-methyltransferase